MYNYIYIYICECARLVAPLYLCAAYGGNKYVSFMVSFDLIKKFINELTL